MEINKEEKKFVPEDEGYVLLADSYDAVVATVGGDRYDEYCLYQKDDVYEIHYFSKGSSDVKEYHAAYRSDKSCADDIFKFIRKERLKSLVNKKGSGLRGAYKVIKFRDGDKLIRLSSDDVPDKRHAVFDGFRTCLLKHLDKDKKI